LAAVYRYVATNKQWKARDYRIEAPKRDRGLIMYEVFYFADLKPPVYPGGGESFEAYYDPKRDKVAYVLHGQ
jgi:hypothetical protein